MDPVKLAKSEEEEAFPFGTDWAIGRDEEPAPAEEAVSSSPKWDNDYGEAHRHDSVDEEADGKMRG